MIKSLLIIFIFLLSLYAIGAFVWKLCGFNQQQDVFANVFIRMILGLVFSVSLFSIIITRGDTISIAILAIMGICIYYVHSNANTHEVCDTTRSRAYVADLLDMKLLVVLLSSTVAFFLFHALFFFNEPYNNEVHFDYFCYSALGDCMLHRGIESLNCVNDLLCEVNVKPSPYHYFDIWMTMLVASLFNITSAESIFVETYVVLAVLYTLGAVAIIRCFSDSWFYTIIGATAVLLTGVVCTDVAITLDSSNILSRLVFHSPLENTKTLAFSLFMELAIFCYLKDRNLFYYAMMAVPLVCITVTPAIYVGLAVAIFVDFIFNVHNRRNLMFVGITLMMISVFILCFYFLRDTGAYAMEDFSLRLVKENVQQGWSVLLKSLIKYPLFLLLIHIPFIILFVLIYMKNQESRESVRSLLYLIVFTVFVEITGFMVSSLYDGNYDKFQFFDMPSMILPSVYMIFFAILMSYSRAFIIKLAVVVLYIVLIIIGNSRAYFQTGLRGTFYNMNDAEDVAYIQSIEKEFIEKHKNTVGVGIRDVYDDAFPYRTRVGLPYQFCPQIATLNLKTINICTLAPIREEWNNEETRNRKANNTFTRFAERYQEEYGVMSDDSLQLQFCKQNSIEFMIVVDGQQIPKIFEPYVDTIFYRPHSTEMFVFFKDFRN